MSRRILFVDDESNVLQGLRRMLRPKRQEWDMAFAASGEEALCLLDEKHFDVVVTDMRMPMMDGAALLHEVMERHPGVARIVLSGHSDLDLVVRSVLPAHQYVSKPCSPEKLQDVISKALEVQDIVSVDTLREMVSRIESLPSLSEAYHQLTEEMNKPEPSIAKVGEIISHDISMSAKILKLVNSSFFGFARHISSPEQAVALLGLKVIKALVLSVNIFSEFHSEELRQYSLSGLWDHSMRVSTLCRDIAAMEKMDAKMQDECFIAGLLHDVGKLILASTFTDRYNTMLTQVREQNRVVRWMEFETFGTTHAEVGAYLMGLWGLPDAVVESIAFHHAPMYPERGLSTVGVVHAANWLDHAYYVLHSNYAIPDLAEEYLHVAGVGDRIEAWKELVVSPEEREEHGDEET
jgi:putative nucleotidyltransferase with HDIG domain